MRLFATRPLVGLLAMTLFAGTASAQTVGRVVAFGDSYADNGNAFRLAGVPFPSVYPTGRFSGGTNFVDTLSGYYRVPQLNFAIGGAQAGTGNVTAGLPGFAQEYQGFVASGQTFQSTDILALSIGGNDARAYRLGGGTMAGVAASAAAAAAQATTGINALVGRGARTIVFLAGDVGRLPEAIGQANAAIGTAYSTAYNGGIQTTLATVAANGGTVAYVDLTAVGNEITKRPTAFGITDTVNACPVPQCIADPSLQAKYLFYVDGVHLTSAGFDIVGRYAINQLEAPYEFRATAALPQKIALAFGQTLNARLDLGRGRTATDERPLAFYTLLDGFRGRRDADASGYGFDYRSYGATLGAEYSAGGAVFGVAGNYARPKLDGYRGLKVDGDAWSIGGYAGFASDGLFAQGYASYGWHDLTQVRAAVVNPLVARSDARTIGAGGRVGYLAAIGGTRIGPVVDVSYARTKLPGYTETGDTAAALTVSRQRLSTLTGGAGIELRHDFGTGGVAPYLRGTVERDLSGNARTIRYAATAAPTIVNSFVLPRDRHDLYGALAGGLSAAIVPGVALDVDLRSSIARKQGRDASAFAGLRVAL